MVISDYCGTVAIVRFMQNQEEHSGLDRDRQLQLRPVSILTRTCTALSVSTYLQSCSSRRFSGWKIHMKQDTESEMPVWCIAASFASKKTPAGAGSFPRVRPSVRHTAGTMVAVVGDRPSRMDALVRGVGPVTCRCWCLA